MVASATARDLQYGPFDVLYRILGSVHDAEDFGPGDLLARLARV